jgi:hypothetical protein
MFVCIYYLYYASQHILIAEFGNPNSINIKTEIVRFLFV